MLREDSIVESAKQRSLRVPLDHFVKKDWIVRWKYFLIALATAVAAAYVAWIFLGGKAGQMQASPGPLAAVHAGWDNDCQACHQTLKPLRSDAVHLTSLGASRAAIRESLDQKCITCHNEPEHHHAAKPDEVMSCSACHRDHLGRMADIVRPADSNCLGCHRQINLHRTGPSALTKATENVTGFGPIPKDGEGPHPEFRSLSSDPGNIKFNHWLHMQPGAWVRNLDEKDEKKRKRLNDLNERFRPQYAKFAKAEGLIELDCTACHEEDAGGQYMKPIAYEHHCQACHPLQLSLPEGQGVAEVPHGLTASRLAPALDGLLLSAHQKQASAAPLTADESGRAPLIPGRTLGSNLAQKIRQDVLGRRDNAAKEISAKCLQCHETNPTGESVGALPELKSPNIPARWLRHARFDHTAHRHVKCKDCHAEAFAFEQREKPPQFIKPGAGQAAALDSEKVMIVRLGDKDGYGCAKCHNPALAKSGGARHDCAECHEYHDRDKLIGAKPSSVTASIDRVQGSGFRVQERGQKLTLGLRLGEAADTPPSPALLNLRLASFTSIGDTKSAFVGVSSCASVGCHGEVKPSAHAWRTALSTFFGRGPHGQAYDVLWTFRGREMTRLLAPTKTDDKPLSDAAHFDVLQKRCVGCHATPLPEGVVANENSYALGVHCESCHGAAGSWLHSHYQTGFSRGSAPGFIDTRQLDRRAETCMKCHVGPNGPADNQQVVDHDLIAAGHPRLAFEFHTYFQSLPVHWDRAADEAKHPGAFHFRSWLAGHEQVAAHKKVLADERPLDFANLDCFACHHSLAAESWRQPAKFDSLKAVPWPWLALPKADGEVSLADRLELARKLIVESKDDGRWDAALQSYLATGAIVGDIRNDTRAQVSADLAKLDSALAAVAVYLGDTSFAGSPPAGRPPTPYDSPTSFNPQSSSYVDLVQPVLEALKQLEIVTAAR